MYENAKPLYTVTAHETAKQLEAVMK